MHNKEKPNGISRYNKEISRMFYHRSSSEIVDAGFPVIKFLQSFYPKSDYCVPDGCTMPYTLINAADRRPYCFAMLQ